jgi:hypothetical protein
MGFGLYVRYQDAVDVDASLEKYGTMWANQALYQSRRSWLLPAVNGNSEGCILGQAWNEGSENR